MLKNLYLFLCIVFVTSSSCPAYAQLISTTAGDGIAGYSGDGSAATLASLDSPASIAIDGSGNIYISDQFHSCVRKIDRSGIITTIAGTGIIGYNGDGIATAAQLNLNWGIAVDAPGNIYIADQQNYIIRKVTPGPGGIITTIAGDTSLPHISSGDGGPAVLARFQNPFSITLDISGNIYIGDQDAHRVRKISTTGIINTIAGNGSDGYSGDGMLATNAQIGYAAGMAIDAAGNLFICDAEYHCVRKVNTAGIITTVAGTGVAGYFGDGGMATACKLDLPTSVYLDNIGHMFIADCHNNRVRSVNTSTGIISTIAGTGVPGFYGDGGLATNAKLTRPIFVTADDSANIYISDLLNVRIRKIRTQNLLYFTVGHSQALSICENALPESIDSMLSIVDHYYSGSVDTWNHISGPSHGALGGFPYSATSTGGALYPVGMSYRPATGYSGNDSFKIKVGNGILSDTTTIYVTVVPTVPPIGAINGASWVCQGGTTTLTDSITGGFWSISNLNATVSGGVVSGQTAGVDTIRYIITNMCGTAAASITVTVEPLPYAGTITGASQLCTGSSILLNDDITGGIWSSSSVSGIAITPHQDSCIVTAASDGMATIYYTVKDSFCSSAAVFNVTIDSFPNAGIITGPANVCLGSMITITDAATGGTWQASNSNASFDSGIVAGLSVGIDTMSYTVSNFCGTAISTIIITIIPSPAQPAITQKGSELSTTGGYSSYNWTLNGNAIPGAVTDSYTVTKSGIYAVIITNAFGCPVSSQPVDAGECVATDIAVFPNPAQSTIIIQWCKPVTARLFCADGKQIKIMENVNEIDMGELPNANYILAIYDNLGNLMTTKVITKLTQ